VRCATVGTHPPKLQCAFGAGDIWDIVVHIVLNYTGPLRLRWWKIPISWIDLINWLAIIPQVIGITIVVQCFRADPLQNMFIEALFLCSKIAKG